MRVKKPAETGSGGGRERLLAASMRLFATKGYAATSVRDIVRAAGVTAPSLYHHFGNKEGLFLAILAAGQERIEANHRQVIDSGGSAAVRILRLARTYVALRREYADFAWAVLRIVMGPREAAPRLDLRALMVKKIRHFEQLVEEGLARGEFRPCSVHHVALAIVGAIELASRPDPFEQRPSPLDGALEGMLAVILEGIASTHAGETPARGAAAGPATAP